MPLHDVGFNTQNLAAIALADDQDTAHLPNSRGHWIRLTLPVVPRTATRLPALLDVQASAIGLRRKSGLFRLHRSSEISFNDNDPGPRSQTPMPP